MDAIEFMQKLDADYRAASGLTERRLYSIFYSRVAPSHVMVIGYNPGGDPDHWDESLLASRSFYENGEHEYVDCHYPLAVAMRRFLTATFSLDSVEQIREIPKTNLIFRRSPGQDSLTLRPAAALDEARPFVEKIIQRVQPHAILFEGTVTLDQFERIYCEDVSRFQDGPPVTTPNGRNHATIFRLDSGHVRCLGRRVTLIGLGHPSKYAGRAEWHEVIARARRVIGDIDRAEVTHDPDGPGPSLSEALSMPGDHVEFEPERFPDLATAPDLSET